MIKNDTINKAIEYIMAHLSDNITLEEVADYCHLSKYYFDRLFKEETGENVYGFIKRVKMEQSALKLKVERTRRVTDIGLDYGYSASNYSSAFKQHHSISPAVFRKELIEKINFDQKTYEDIDRKITIQELPDYLVTYERCIANYTEMRISWCEFMDKYQQYQKEDTIYFDRTFDDPTITDVDRCIYDICMSIEEKDTDLFSNTTILKGGKFVVYPFKGFITEIMPLHQALIGMWFARSPYELDDRYSFTKYQVVRPDYYMEFDICIPIK